MPVSGVDLILGNDLAGERMGGAPPPILQEVSSTPSYLKQQIFPFCAVTRSMTRRVSTPEDPEPQTSTRGDEINDLNISPLFAEPASAGACLSTGEVRQMAWCQRHPPLLHNHKPPCAHKAGDKELARALLCVLHV